MVRPIGRPMARKTVLSAKSLTADLKALLPAIATRSGLPMLSGVRLAGCRAWTANHLC
jgi:hypothetical protein